MRPAGSTPGSEPGPGRSRRFFLRRILRRILLAAAAVAGGLLLIAACGLQFPAIQDRLAEELEDWAARQTGMRVRIEELRGFLPVRVRIRQLTLADTGGIWFRVEGLSLRARAGALMKGELRLRSLSAERVDLPRLPAERVGPGPAAPRRTPPGEAAVRIPAWSVDAFRIRVLAVGEDILPGEGPSRWTVSGGARGDELRGVGAELRAWRLDSGAGTLAAQVRAPGAPAPVEFRADAVWDPGAGLEPWAALLGPGSARIRVEAELHDQLLRGRLEASRTGGGRLEASGSAARDRGDWDAQLDILAENLRAWEGRVLVPRARARVEGRLPAFRVDAEGGVRFGGVEAELRLSGDRDGTAWRLSELEFRQGANRLAGNLEGDTATGSATGRLTAFADLASLPVPGPPGWAGTLRADIEGSQRDGEGVLRSAGTATAVSTPWGTAEQVAFRLESRGPWDAPRATLALEAQGGMLAGFDRYLPDEPLSLSMEANLDPGLAEAEATLSTGGDRIRGRLAAPVRGSIRPWAWSIAETPARLELDGQADVHRWASPALGPDAPRGALHLALQARIPRDRAPTLAGRLEWRDGRFEVPGTGARMEPIEVVLVGDDSSLRIESAQAGDGGRGRMVFDGEWRFGGERDPPMRVSASLSGFRFLDLPYATGLLDGGLTLEGDLKGATLSGRVTARDVEFRIPSRLPPSIPNFPVVVRGETAAPETGGTRSEAWDRLMLDVGIRAARARVRGRGLDSEWRGEVRLAGTPVAPALRGGLESLRGSLLFLGRRLLLTEGRVLWDGLLGEPPLFSGSAVAQAAGIQARIEVRGSLAAPEFQLASDPPLPEDEILSLLLFGRSADRIAPLQALRLAQGLNLLRGGGGAFDILARGQSWLHVDRIDLRQDGEEGQVEAVSVGKHLGDRVYVEGAAGLGTGTGSVTVEVALTPSLSLETESAPGLREGIRLRWTRDY